MIIKNLDLVLGIIICIYTLLVNIIMGRIAFSGFFILVGGSLIAYHFAKVKLMSMASMEIPMKLFKVCALVGLCIFIIVQALIIFFPKKDVSNSDYVIVLGAGIRGETISLTLKYRLDAAISYFDNNPNVNIVVSGGQGQGEDITEAEAMSRYLISNGIPEDKIIKEDKSTSTSENLIFSKEKIESNSGQCIEDLKIKIITTDFHALRSSMLAKKYDYKSVTLYTSDTVKVISPIMYTREFFALIKSVIFD